MTQVNLSHNTLNNLKPKGKAYFLHDCNVKVFGVKVTPSGKINYIAEAWCKGKFTRKTKGEFPLLPFQKAKSEALVDLSDLASGETGIVINHNFLFTNDMTLHNFLVQKGGLWTDTQGVIECPSIFSWTLFLPAVIGDSSIVAIFALKTHLGHKEIALTEKYSHLSNEREASEVN